MKKHQLQTAHARALADIGLVKDPFEQIAMLHETKLEAAYLQTSVNSRLSQILNNLLHTGATWDEIEDRTGIAKESLNGPLVARAQGRT